MQRREALKALAGGAAAATVAVTSGASALPTPMELHRSPFASGVAMTAGETLPPMRTARGLVDPSSWWSAEPTDARLWIDTMKSLSPVAKARMLRRVGR